MIIVRIWEGLGNQLFQYAYARSLMHRGQDVYIDLKKSFDESFDKKQKRTQSFRPESVFFLSKLEVVGD